MLDLRRCGDADVTFERLRVEFRILEAIHVDVDIAGIAHPFDGDAVHFELVGNGTPRSRNPVRFRSRHRHGDLGLAINRAPNGDRLTEIFNFIGTRNC